MKTIKEMTPLEKAALLKALAEILVANNTVGTFKNLEKRAADVSVDIINSIK